MSDLEKSIAVLFKRKGKEFLTEKEFVFSASMDMRWFSPKEAQKMLDAGIEGGLLKKTNGNLLPTFDFHDVSVPIDYKPTPEVLKTASRRTRDLFSELVETISKSKSISKREVVSKVNKKQEMLGIDIEPAALLVACDYGLSVDNDYIERATHEVLCRELHQG
jgi:hypothetical protein